MGIVYNTRSGYINTKPCVVNNTRLRARIVLTQKNQEFLKSLGLKIVSGGK